MKELEENTIEQIRTLLNYLEQTDLLKKLPTRFSENWQFLMRFAFMRVELFLLCKSHFLQK